MTAGIYKIACTATNNFYVGSSRDIEYRWRAHRLLLCRNAHHSVVLQRAWNKHGAEAFRLEILEVAENDNLLLEREQHYLDTLRPAYNSALTAGGGPLKGRKHTDEARAKMSAAQLRIWERRRASGDVARTDVHKAKIAASHVGLRPTDESRTKMSESAKRRTWALTPEGRARISAGSKGNKRAAGNGEKVRRALTGRILPEERKRRISDGLRQWHAERRKSNRS